MPQLDLAHAEVNRWQLARRRPGRSQRAAERDVAVADHGVQDHVRLGFEDSPYHPGDFGARGQEVLLPGDLAAKCRELLPNNGVGRVRVDGIPSQEEEPAGAQGVEGPADGREHLLIGGSAGVDDVRGLFEALVLHRVNKQMIVSLEDGEELLSAGGGPAAEQGADLLLGDQPLGFARERWLIRPAIANEGLEFLPPDSASLVDFLDCQERGIGYGALAEDHRPRE